MTVVPMSEALDALAHHLNTDRKLAASWSANLAMIGIDAGADPRQAQVSAGKFMKQQLGVTHPPGLYSQPDISVSPGKLIEGISVTVEEVNNSQPFAFESED